jgi:hypothetical protein
MNIFSLGGKDSMSLKDRKSTIQAIGWVRDMEQSKSLDLNPPYQRRSVWNKDYKQFFIDSILRNYPIPPIFVNLEVTKEGKTKYHVIDGKQRLLSILEFLRDEFALSAKHSVDIAPGQYFSQLDSAIQRSFYSYFLPFEFFTEITNDVVVNIFDRFNRNVQRLNEQELRHARYAGVFITTMEGLADDPFWQNLHFFSLADTRRMKDVEYVSLIFALTMNGIQEGDPLESYYADYDEEFPEVGTHMARFNTVKTMMLRFSDLVQQTRFHNKADFYSLWSALLDFTDAPNTIDYALTEQALSKFANRIDQVPDAVDAAVLGDDAVAYSQAVRQGTTKEQNRVIRKNLLLEKIATV